MTEWISGSVDDFCEVEYGTRVTRKRDGGTKYPVYGGGGATFFLDDFNRQDQMIVSRFAMSEECVRFVSGKFFLNDSGLTVRTRDASKMSQDFLDQLLLARSNEIYATARGTAQKNMDMTMFRGMEITFPDSLKEQKRIVELLDAATVRITELAACYEEARTHSNNLFMSALQGALESNPDRPVRTLGDICRIEMGRTPSRGDSKGWDKAFKTTNHWASIADLTACNGRVLTSTKERISDYAAKTTKVVPAGTLMMSFKLSIGKLAFAGCDLYTNEAIAAFHLHEESGVDSDFLYWALSVVDWSALTKGSEKVKGATMNKAKLNLLEIPVPSLDEQKRIVARLDSMRVKTSEMVAAYDDKLQAAKDLRQSILEVAFAGDL